MPDQAIVPTFDPTLAVVLFTAEKQILNYGIGTMAWCLDSIVMSNDLQDARSKLRERQETDKSLKEKLIESKKITAGNLSKASSCRIGKTILDIQKVNVEKRRKFQSDKVKKEHETYVKVQHNAHEVRMLNLEYQARTVSRSLSSSSH